MRTEIFEIELVSVRTRSWESVGGSGMFGCCSRVGGVVGGGSNNQNERCEIGRVCVCVGFDLRRGREGVRDALTSNKVEHFVVGKNLV